MTMKCLLNNLDGQVEGSNKDPEAQHEENSVEDLQSAVVIEDKKKKSVI